MRDLLDSFIILTPLQQRLAELQNPLPTFLPRRITSSSIVKLWNGSFIFQSGGSCADELFLVLHELLTITSIAWCLTQLYHWGKCRDFSELSRFPICHSSFNHLYSLSSFSSNTLPLSSWVWSWIPMCSCAYLWPSYWLFYFGEDAAAEGRVSAVSLLIHSISRHNQSPLTTFLRIDYKNVSNREDRRALEKVKKNTARNLGSGSPWKQSWPQPSWLRWRCWRSPARPAFWYRR